MRGPPFRLPAAFASALVLSYALALGNRSLLGADAPGQVEGTVVVSERFKGRTGSIVVLLEAEGRKLDAPRDRPRVRQRDARFEPDFLVIALGQSIDFTNDERTALEHNVFSMSEARSFDLGLLGAGKRASVAFDKPGEVSVYCSIHKLMEATVYVAPSRLFAVVDAATGRFKIADVPPGSWKARTWVSSKRCPNANAELDVRPGETERLDLAIGKRA